MRRGGESSRKEPQEKDEAHLSTLLSSMHLTRRLWRYSPRPWVYVEIFPGLLKNFSNHFPPGRIPISNRSEVLARKRWLESEHNVIPAVLRESVGREGPLHSLD